MALCMVGEGTKCWMIGVNCVLARDVGSMLGVVEMLVYGVIFSDDDNFDMDDDDKVVAVALVGLFGVFLVVLVVGFVVATSGVVKLSSRCCC